MADGCWTDGRVLALVGSRTTVRFGWDWMVLQQTMDEHEMEVLYSFNVQTKETVRPVRDKGTSKTG